MQGAHSGRTAGATAHAEALVAAIDARIAELQRIRDAVVEAQAVLAGPLGAPIPTVAEEPPRPEVAPARPPRGAALDIEGRVLMAIRSGLQTPVAIAQGVSVSLPRVKRALQRLRLRGEVVVHGHRRSARYHPTR